VYWMIGWDQMAPLSAVLEHDRLIVAATDRQRHLLRSDIVAQTTEEAGHMEAIGATIAAMAAKIRTLWPDAEAMPVYPAFR
jgi:Mn-containing catalase